MGRLALLALLALSLAGCGSSETAPPPPPAAPTDGTQEGAHDVAGVGLEGESISLGDFRGRPVLVNVWSSW
jgi:cytochrome oxidase Cu insertion factor (SCO1/SenC/PrrC family)